MRLLAPIAMIAVLGCKSPPPRGEPSSCVSAKSNLSSFASSGSGATFCLFDRDDPQGKRDCFALDLASGRFEKSSAVAVTKPVPSISGWVVNRFERKVEVCAQDGQGCRSIEPIAFVPPDASAFAEPIRKHIPADTDGTRVFLVRHEGKRSEKIFGETYELSTQKLLARFPIEADAHVDRVQWLGKRVLITVCVDEGPSCLGSFVDPISGAREALELQMFGVEQPVVHVRDDLYAFVWDRGRAIQLRRVDAGVVDATIELGLPALDAEARVIVERRGANELLVAHAPGDVALVDLAARTTKRWSPPRCP